MKGGRIRSSIECSDTNRNCVRVVFILCVLDEHVPIAVFIKGFGIKNFKFFHITASASALTHEFLVGEGALGILVEELHVRMGWGRIEVVVELLAVFTVVPFMSSDAKEALLEDGIDAIPKPQAKTETLVVIAKTRKTVFSPSVCTRTGVCMREMRPGVAICRVIFTDSGLWWWLRIKAMKME